MTQSKKMKVVLLLGCVVAGEDRDALEEVTLDRSDANYLIACGTAADPKTETGKELIERAEEAAAPAKRTRRKGSKPAAGSENEGGGDNADE